MKNVVLAVLLLVALAQATPVVIKIARDNSTSAIPCGSGTINCGPYGSTPAGTCNSNMQVTSCTYVCDANYFTVTMVGKNIGTSTFTGPLWSHKLASTALGTQTQCDLATITDANYPNGVPAGADFTLHPPTTNPSTLVSSVDIFISGNKAELPSGGSACGSSTTQNYFCYKFGLP